MHIALNCRCFLSPQFTGIGRYGYELVKALGELDHTNQYYLYARKNIFDFKRRVPAQLKTKNIHERIDYFDRTVEKLIPDVDLYHALSPEIIPTQDKTKVIVTIHDLIFKAYPAGHTQNTIDLTEKNLVSCFQKAMKVICCSENTFKDLQAHYQFPRSKAVVIYPGINEKIFYRIDQEEERVAEEFLKDQGITKPFILSVGTLEPRKNLKNMLEAFHILKKKGQFEGQFVVVGMKGWMSEDLEHWIEDWKLTNDVIFLGYVSTDGLRYLYNKAQVFLYPSFYEGFGFPIVEAFYCGAPVVTSNVSSCPEIASDAALTVDPSKSEEIAESAATIMADQNLRQTLREKGFRRAMDFNFRKTAEKTLNVYQEVCRQ